MDDSPAKNVLRQIAAPSATREGMLAPLTANRIQGWLFQPGAGPEAILLVPPKTKLGNLPNNHARVIAADVADGAAPLVDVKERLIDVLIARCGDLGTEGSWLRHPQLGDGSAKNEVQDHKKVLDSWKGAFSYVEDTEAGVTGLRLPQIGAVHAVHAHWSVADTPATVVMPTGTGKTETMTRSNRRAPGRHAVLL